LFILRFGVTKLKLYDLYSMGFYNYFHSVT